MKENLNLFEEAKFFSDENKKIFEHIIDKAKSMYCYAVVPISICSRQHIK